MHLRRLDLILFGTLPTWKTYTVKNWTEFIGFRIVIKFIVVIINSISIWFIKLIANRKEIKIAFEHIQLKILQLLASNNIQLVTLI